MVNFTLWTLNPRKESWFPLNRMLGGPLMRSGYFGEENFLHWRDSKPRTVHPIAYTDYGSRGLPTCFFVHIKFLSCILVYKSQQDAQVTEFILSEDCSTCFGFHYDHLQEHKTTVITVSGNHYTVLLSAAIVEELELI